MHRHANKGYKYSRDKGPRELMLRNLATSVILHEKVKTTNIKAKGIQPIVEKMITLAKKGDMVSIRAIKSYLLDEAAGRKLIIELAPLYKERRGGYTRITKVGSRVGDNAKMSVIELIDIEKLEKKVKTPAKDKTKKTEAADSKTNKAKSGKAKKGEEKETKKAGGSQPKGGEAKK